MAARSCSERLASRVSVILLLSGESPLGSSSALELSMLGLVSVISSLLAMVGKAGAEIKTPGHPLVTQHELSSRQIGSSEAHCVLPVTLRSARDQGNIKGVGEANSRSKDTVAKGAQFSIQSRGRACESTSHGGGSNYWAS